jgi:hypothetical protein
MRSAVLQLPITRTQGERRQVLRAAIRQLDRAEIYLAAVDAMDMDDREAQRAVRQLEAGLDGLRRYLIELRRRT